MKRSATTAQHVLSHPHGVPALPCRAVCNLDNLAGRAACKSLGFASGMGVLHFVADPDTTDLPRNTSVWLGSITCNDEGLSSIEACLAQSTVCLTTSQQVAWGGPTSCQAWPSVAVAVCYPGEPHRSLAHLQLQPTHTHTHTHSISAVRRRPCVVAGVWPAKNRCRSRPNPAAAQHAHLYYCTVSHMCIEGIPYGARNTQQHTQSVEGLWLGRKPVRPLSLCPHLASGVTPPTGAVLNCY